MHLPFSKNKVLSSLAWKLLERSATQGMQFIIQIILARLLLPSDYGMIALVMIFILLANVFVQKGFNTALIQKKQSDELDFSSALYLSLFVAAILYVILFLASPYIAIFYREPMLETVLKVLAITLFFGAFNSIQNAYISKHMMFKKLFYSSLGAILVSGAVGIIAAVANLGIWALVIQQLVNQVMVTLILWFTVKWRPHLLFSFDRIKGLFSFGWKILASSIINTLYADIRTLIIGRVYSPATLGFYNNGKQFPQLLVSNIDGTIQSVMFPTLSSHQDDRVRVKEIVRRSIVTSSFIIFPMMMGLAVVARPLVIILLTDKWLPSVPFLQIFCLMYAIIPIHTANLQAINALGRSDLFLKLEIIKKTMGISIIVITLPFGVHALAIGSAIGGLIGSFLNAYPNKSLLNYSYSEQLKDIFPSLSISFIMGAVVYTMNYLSLPVGVILGSQVVVGSLLYVLLAMFFKLESFIYLKQTIKDLLKQYKKDVVKT